METESGKMNTELTEREKEVLKLLVEGLNNSEIADKLFISTHTAKSHLEKIYEKLNLHNRVLTAIYAVKNNLV